MRAIPASLVLVDDTDSITIRPSRAAHTDPIMCKQWDLGAPEVRAASSDRAGADGTIDRAGYTGSRTVVLDLQVFGDYVNSAYAYVERLTAMAHPSRRPRLRITRNSPEAYGQTWEMQLRGNPFTLAYGQRAAAMLELQLSFAAPLGYLEGDNQGYDSADVDAVADTGIALPLAMPLATGTGGPENPYLTLTVGGTAPVPPIVYIYGPATDPEVRTDDDERFVFSGLVLDSGQFVQVDMSAGTVRLGGATDASVFHLVDFTLSTFWTWNPGVHVVRYIATSGRMAVHWRDRRHTI